MGRQRWLLILIAALVAASVYVLTTIPLKLGLDLRGGAQLTIQVSPADTGKPLTEADMTGVQKVIENRINGLGVAESQVQVAGQDQIVVQLPGVSDPDQAERVLGGTAQLDFREQTEGTEARLPIEARNLQELQLKQLQLRDGGDAQAIAANKALIKSSADTIATLFKDAGITGKNLTDAFADNQGGSLWSVAIRFDKEGGDQFAELTKRLAGTGRTIGIFLDNVLISSPTVGPEHAQTGIQGGGAIITGNFDAKSATELGVQLKGGSLPVPIKIVEKRGVSASLGQDSISRSLYAGLAGLALVFVFMIVYYRLPGIIASISLAIYALLCLAAFDILGVTMTLPGIAGFILSVGMAVDANVLIFERTREELQAGKSLYRSVESGFFRAFSSILDGNVTTAIACVALIYLGSGLVRGFGVTLVLGVVISMFTALTCTRTFLMYVLTQPALRRPEYFAPGVKGAADKSSVETA
jgi:preprotein translocase subunit SecD